MSDAIVPIALFLVLAGAIMAVAEFRTRRSRERDIEYAQETEDYRKARDSVAAQQEAIRTRLTELNVRVQSMESMLRAVE
ncbi:hypothetical protein [Streptomyces flavofungini]|uniref:hypothetical protein n=1 Tax=Streptomyces flavofungini TaxID=68200 RepID=UPI0025B0AB60|nr:hypothetical protein [Streptomyces flavofungini]WJV45664.1 hypothetical protein QUY26_09040 [Streptomyces flavofungini]